MARKSNKQSNQKIVPQVTNDVKEPEKAPSEAQVNPIYQRFLDSLSSSEKDVILAEPIRGIQSFRKFLENLKDEELLLLVK